jgi:hypothetical protein
MQGAFVKLLSNFPNSFQHNHHSDDQKRVIRYLIADDRITVLERFAEPFAIGPLERAKHGEQVVSYLVPRNEDYWDHRIPDEVRFEYFAGAIKESNDGETYVLFAYLWFESLCQAREYVEKQGQAILGGWH